MLRRANVYGACIACGLCLLLLLASSRYTDNVNYRPTYESHRSIKHLLRLTSEDGDEATSQLQATDSPLDDAASNAERILNKTRLNLRRNLADFKSRNIPGVRRLEDLIPEEGGQPLRNIIVSTWRSGTTFLGEVLNSMAGNFYHYEPLLSYGEVQIRGPPHADSALRMLRKMLTCNFSDMDEYFEYGREHLYQFNHNTRLWNYCKYDKELCADPVFTSRFCRIFPFQSMKLVRLRLRLAEELLADPELNVKVMLLVRDPRGVLKSRHNREFCPPSPDCWQASLLCADMVSDYVAAGHLLKLYPDRFLVLRYEDLVLRPDTIADTLLKFLKLGNSPELKEFLKMHTRVEVPGVSSTYRVSKDVPFRWKNSLAYENVTFIERQCKEAMAHWGYRKAHNASNLVSQQFIPIVQYTVH